MPKNKSKESLHYSIYDFVGTVGVSVLILTYVLLQVEKISSKSLLYSALNAAGSSLIIVSLARNFNFSAFIVEFFWALISIYGIAKYLLKK